MPDRINGGSLCSNPESFSSGNKRSRPRKRHHGSSPEWAKKPVTSEHHNRSQITDHRKDGISGNGVNGAGHAQVEGFVVEHVDRGCVGADDVGDRFVDGLGGVLEVDWMAPCAWISMIFSLCAPVHVRPVLDGLGAAAVLH